MALFRWPDDRGRLDFELLRESSAALYFSRAVLDDHVAWLRKEHYVVATLDCSGWRSEEDFHAEISRVLSFPDYYGRNLDAFNDCLCGVDVPEQGGLVLAFYAFDVFHGFSSERAWDVLDIIARWSRHFLLVGRRLLSLVHSNDRTSRVKPVGARPVLWNTTERTIHVQEKLAEARNRERT